MILRWSLMKYGIKLWVTNFCAHIRELLDYVTDRELIGILSASQNRFMLPGVAKLVTVFITILTFSVSARKKLCCTSSFGGSSRYTFFSPV
jgi:hypothetical protein